MLRVPGWISMIRVLRASYLDHLHIVDNPGNLVLFASLFKRLLPTFSFCVFGNDLLDLGKKMSTSYALALKLGARAASRVDCLTPVYHAFSGAFSSQIPLERFVLAPCSFSDYSQVCIRAERDIDVLFLGRFVEGKGLKFLVEIWPALETLGLNVHICGDGPLRDLAPGPNVYPVKDSFSVLGRTKVILSIQEKENYPSQSLLEAMGSGCAIVATDVGCTRVLLDPTTSLLVAPQGSEILEAIRKIISSPALAKILGEKAMKKATEQFTVEKYADYFLREVLQF